MLLPLPASLWIVVSCVHVSLAYSNPLYPLFDLRGVGNETREAVLKKGFGPICEAAEESIKNIGLLSKSLRADPQLVVFGKLSLGLDY